MPAEKIQRRNFLQRKYLQFQVTLSPYMLTNSEQAVFAVCLALFTMFLGYAMLRYLPQHAQTIARRAYFYVVGDESVIRKEDLLDYSL